MNNEYSIIWKNFLNLLTNKIALVSINSWFKNCKIYNIEDIIENEKKSKIITIEVASDYIKEALIKRYLDTIEDLMESILGTSTTIKFVLTDEISKQKNDVSKKENNFENTMTLNKPPTIKKNQTTKDNIIEKYTFDNFIIGETNRLAHTAALAVADQPGKLYNPFFIHGKSGLGKTHLMHAIGNYIKKNSNKKILYVTCEQFKTDFTSINLKKDYNYIQSFKEKYRNVDILMIDDIQFLENAEKTQQEFFHTFNNLYDLNKQIIISSDRSPDDLKYLEERLRTRFSWGLTVNVYPPDDDLKKRIVKNKMSGHAVATLVSDEVIDYIAVNSENDVRHIEGAVTRLYAYAAIMGPNKIDLEFAHEALKDYLKNSIYIDSSITKIQKAVADYYGLTIDILKGKKRSNNINYPRQIAIYLCRECTEESYPKIGLEFGNRDHSTIIHSYEKIKKDLKSNSKLNEIIKEIKNNIS